MMRGAGGFLFTALLVSGVYAQQVRHVDLSLHSTSDKIQTPIAELTRSSDCPDKRAGLTIDGEVKPDIQRHILVAVTKVSNDSPELGGEIDAEVMLKNIGPEPVTIPWIINPIQLDASKDENYKEWEIGQFVISLRDKDRQRRLKSMSRILYSSPYTNGSTLTLLDGEWVTATVNFKLEADWPEVDGAVKLGDGQLIAEWHQEMRTYKRMGCEINAGFFPYKKYYQQEHGKTTPLTVKTTRGLRL